MIQARAFAKINVGLRVSRADSSGLHPVHGVFQSIDWADHLGLAPAEADGVTTSSGGAVIDEMANLAWRAVVAVRALAPTQPPLHLTLDKQVPVAAGLGGGSADAAAALAMTGRLLGVDRAELEALAPTLGSDVPFCLTGGKATVNGVGERVAVEPMGGAYALALVVPPIEVATAAVYRAWDDLGGPTGPPTDAAAVPPEFRGGVLANDLLPAALAVAPDIADWRSELAHAWGRPVLLSGSGPTLYGFFLDIDEAESALSTAPPGARAVEAAVPRDHGWVVHIAGEDRGVDSRGRVVGAQER